MRRSSGITLRSFSVRNNDTHPSAARRRDALYGRPEGGRPWRSGGFACFISAPREASRGRRRPFPRRLRPDAQPGGYHPAGGVRGAGRGRAGGIFLPGVRGAGAGPCLARLETLRGTGTPALLAAVYGNRAVDDALLEMKNALSARGFRTVAAAEIVAPHSLNTKIGEGRPDGKDPGGDSRLCRRSGEEAGRRGAGGGGGAGQHALPGFWGHAAEAYGREGLYRLRPVRGRLPRPGPFRRTGPGKWIRAGASPVCAAYASARRGRARSRCRCVRQ